MTACTRAALRTGRAVPGVRRGREAFEVLIANCKIVSFLESHLCRIRYHMRRMSHLLIAINTASASTCRIRRYVAFVECKLSIIWSLHLLHPGELQVTKTARHLRLQISRACYLTSASRPRARAEYVRTPPHFLLVIEESRVQ